MHDAWADDPTVTLTEDQLRHLYDTGHDPNPETPEHLRLTGEGVHRVDLDTRNG